MNEDSWNKCLADNPEGTSLYPLGPPPTVAPPPSVEPPAVVAPGDACLQAVNNCTKDNKTGLQVFQGIGLENARAAAADNDRFQCCSYLNDYGQSDPEYRDCARIPNFMDGGVELIGYMGECQQTQQPPVTPPVTPPQRQPNVVDQTAIEQIANDMITQLTGDDILGNNDLMSGINSANEAYVEHIYPVVLHAGNYDPNIVFGGHTGRNNITTVKLMVNGSKVSNEQYFGSIAQAVASIFKSQDETTAIADEYSEFCGPGATYGGGNNARIDTDAKVISMPTYAAHLNDGMCGMIGKEQIEGSYQDAVKTRLDRLDGQFARSYISEIGDSYVSDSEGAPIKLPVADTQSSNIINVSGVQSESLVHTVINFKNGVPSLTRSAVSDTVNASGNDYLVIMTQGLSDAEAFETVRKTPLDGLREVKQLQYMVAQERHDTTEFVPSDHDPFSGIQCTGGICSLVTDGSVGTGRTNLECSFAEPSVQSYGFVVVKLWSQESPTGYKYTTPDNLVTLQLQIRNGQITHETNRNVGPFESTGNFFLFQYSGIKYVVPNAPIGEEQRISDVLALPVCNNSATGAQNPQCCAKIFEAGYIDTLIDAGQSELFNYCISQIEAMGGPPPPTPTPTPTPGAGAGAPPAGWKHCWDKPAGGCPTYKPVVNSDTDAGYTDDYIGSCCQVPENCGGLDNQYVDSAITNPSADTNVCTYLCSEEGNQKKDDACTYDPNVSAHCCACVSDCP
jgi:hypothetical protein